MIAPPNIARRLLSALLPDTHRQVVLSDLDEEFAERVARPGGEPAARMWYRRQVLTSLPGAARMRTRVQLAEAARDFIFGGRLLRRRPVFAATAIGTLILGVGATSAVMTLANTVLVRPLPYLEPDRLVSLVEYERPDEPRAGNLSWPDLLDYQRANQTLSGIAAFNGGARTLTSASTQAERVGAVMVTGNFFEVLGVTAALGRTLNTSDADAAAPPVVVLTHPAWRTRFGADPAVLGRTMILNGISTTVVGVLPQKFEFAPRGLAELWLPLRPTQAQTERKFYHWLSAIGRLRPGVSREVAEADLNRVAASFAPLDPRAHQHTAMQVPTFHDRMVGAVRPMVMVLAAASLMVLLVASANIAGLLLAQSATRTAEMSVRTVMGASRSRLLRQLFVENLAIAVPGGVLGALVGQWMISGLVAALPAAQRVTLPHLASLTLDASALIISLLLTVTASLLFALLPAWRSVRTDRLQSTRGVAGRSARELRMQSALVVVQVALALILLVGAGLIAQSIRKLLDVSPGFRPDHLLTMAVALPDAKYNDADRVHAFQADLERQMSQLPGVLGATTIDQLPLTGAGNTGAFVVKGDVTARETVTLVRTAAANYFSVMGIRLEAGRPFGPVDTMSSAPVVLINRDLAERAFDGDPIGKRIMFPFMPGQEMEIIGVVGNEQFDALDRAQQGVLYFPQTQSAGGSFNLLLRTAGDPVAMVPTAVAAIGRMDPTVPVFSRLTMEQIVNASPAVFRRRSVFTLVGGFAAATLLLAAVGLYGVLAQVVAERTREIGVRLALGASRSGVFGAMLRRGMLPVGIGIGVGLAGSSMAGPLLASLLFGTRPTDPLTLIVVGTLLVVVAFFACVIPARRALRIDPANALRGE